MRDDGPVVRDITTAVYVIPTDAPEADGTLAWDTTIMVLACARAGTARGIGWTYAAAAAAGVITGVLAGVVTGRSAMDVPGAAEAMARAVRNIGRPGIAATAISAVDTALWDLKARLLGVPLPRLLGQARDGVSIYGSGGFTWAVDCLQLDVTRCGGITEFLRGSALAAAHNLQVSGHCAPNLHARVGVAVPNLRHVEYFHDHQRIEEMLFDGALDPADGILTPDPDEPGLGLALRESDAERYRLG